MNIESSGHRLLSYCNVTLWKRLPPERNLLRLSARNLSPHRHRLWRGSRHGPFCAMQDGGCIRWGPFLCANSLTTPGTVRYVRMFRHDLKVEGLNSMI